MIQIHHKNSHRFELTGGVEIADIHFKSIAVADLRQLICNCQIFIMRIGNPAENKEGDSGGQNTGED